MKDGTENLAKFKLLMSDLGLALWEVRGLLDSLWKFTRDNCPAGDIGRFEPADVCAMIGWNRTPPEVLFDALKKRRWIDDFEPCGSRVATVHDWPEHCELSVHRSLALKGLTFADGTEPNQSKLTRVERVRAKRRREERLAAAGGSQPSPSQAEPSRASPSPSQAEPEPSPPPRTRGSGLSQTDRPEQTDLDASTLASPVLFQRWVQFEEHRFKVSGGDDGWLSGSTDDRIFANAVREKAITDKTLADPVAWAKDTIRGKHYDRVKAHHEDAARSASRTGPSEAVRELTANIGTGGTK